MTIEVKNVVGNLMRNSVFETLSSTEIEQKEREQKNQALRVKASEYMAKSNVPSLHASTSKEKLYGQPWLSTKQGIIGFIGTGFLFALLGRRGTGKTQLGVEIAKASALAGKRPFYATAMDFFLHLRAEEKDKGSGMRSVLEDYSRPSLLILDETQERGETSWEDRVLGNLIDRRYGAQKDTLLISNQTKENFLVSMGESVASRIQEKGGTIICDWPSYRSI